MTVCLTMSFSKIVLGRRKSLPISLRYSYLADVPFFVFGMEVLGNLDNLSVIKACALEGRLWVRSGVVLVSLMLR